jgi:hypothetical protein
MPVAVAGATGCNPNQDFAGPRVLHLDLFDDERAALLVDDRCFCRSHIFSLVTG